MWKFCYASACNPNLTSGWGQQSELLKSIFGNIFHRLCGWKKLRSQSKLNSSGIVPLTTSEKFFMSNFFFREENVHRMRFFSGVKFVEDKEFRKSLMSSLVTFGIKEWSELGIYFNPGQGIKQNWLLGNIVECLNYLFLNIEKQTMEFWEFSKALIGLLLTPQGFCFCLCSSNLLRKIIQWEFED